MGFCLNLKKIIVCSVIGGRGSCWGIRFMNCVFDNWGWGSCWGIRLMNCVFGDWGRGEVVGELDL